MCGVGSEVGVLAAVGWIGGLGGVVLRCLCFLKR